MTEARETEARRGLLVALLVAASVGAADIGGAFVLDDPVAIEQSVCVSESLDLGRIASSNFWCEQGAFRSIQSWRPLTVLVWWFLWHLSPTTIPFSLLAVALHVACTAGVHQLGRAAGLSPRASIAGALLFAPLAIHVDAIAPAVGNAELLAAAGILWATIAYLRGRWWCIPAALAAVLAKESGVLAFALIAAAAIVVPNAERFGDRRRAGAIVGAVGLGTLAILAWRASALGAWTGTQIPAFVNPLVDVDFGDRAVAALGIVGRYHRLTLAGGPLSADYAQAAIGVGDATPWVDVLIGGFSLAGWGTLGWLGRRHSAMRLLVLWVLGSSLFVSNLVFVLPAMFAERLFYVPTMAIALLGGVGVDRMLGTPDIRPVLPRIALGAFVVAQLALALTHVARYRDEQRIIEQTVDTTPANARARMWLAAKLIRAGDRTGAREHAEAALQVRPDWGQPMAVVATALDLEGHPEAALPMYRRAMELDPHDADVANLFVQFLLKYGHHGPAKLVYETHAQARGQPDPRVTVP